MNTEIIDEEYKRSVGIYLGLWLSKVVDYWNSLCTWIIQSEQIGHAFTMQKLSMVWDYVEANSIGGSASGAAAKFEWIPKVILHKSGNNGVASINKLGDAGVLCLDDLMANVVVTDPPYFDAISYADLSDMFYIWLKRTLGRVIPFAIATPQAPKSEEATALLHRHGGNPLKANTHFVTKLSTALSMARKQMAADGIMSVMFAHQSTKAWIALIEALFSAGLSIGASWPIHTERPNRSRGLDSSALFSSITVSCRSRVAGSAVSYKDVRKEIEKAVQESVKRFWGYGLRGADLIVACYGPAVGVFGKYERVEKADGTLVKIPELLELAREAARDAIAGEFRGDNLSTLYYVWANLYGVAEQAWDDARLVVQVGGDAENAMEVARGHGIFVVDGPSCRLALLADREKRRSLGIDPNPPLIDALHRSMLLWREEKRPELVGYLGGRDLLEDGPFWKLAQALFEVLPRDTEDWKLINALLGERQTLRSEGKGLADQGPRYPLFGNR